MVIRNTVTLSLYLAPLAVIVTGATATNKVLLSLCDLVYTNYIYSKELDNSDFIQLGRLPV